MFNYNYMAVHNKTCDISVYTTIGEEKLLYGFKNLVSWLGGAIGIFIGYSIFDLSNQIIDVIFNCIARLTTTVV